MVKSYVVVTTASIYEDEGKYMVEIYVGVVDLLEALTQGCPLCLAALKSMRHDQQKILMDLRQNSSTNSAALKVYYKRGTNPQDRRRFIWLHPEPGMTLTDMKFSCTLDLVEVDGMPSNAQSITIADQYSISRKRGQGWRVDEFL